MSEPSLPMGRCLACGVETKLCCQSCRRHGHIDLFFCSAVHQKLLWPFHKLVCGARAHPFRLPVFSQEEADEMLDRLTSAASSTRFRDLQQQIRDALGFDPNILQIALSVLYGLIGKEGSLEQSGHQARNDVVDQDALFINKLRCLNWDWAVAMVNAGNGLSSAMHVCTEHFAFVYDAKTQDAPAIDKASLWHSHLCHRWAASVQLQTRAGVLAAPAAAGRTFVPLSDFAAIPGYGALAPLLLEADAEFNRYLHSTEDPAFKAFAAQVDYHHNKPPDFV